MRRFALGAVLACVSCGSPGNLGDPCTSNGDCSPGLFCQRKGVDRCALLGDATSSDSSTDATTGTDADATGTDATDSASPGADAGRDAGSDAGSDASEATGCVQWAHDCGGFPSCSTCFWAVEDCSAVVVCGMTLLAEASCEAVCSPACTTSCGGCVCS